MNEGCCSKRMGLWTCPHRDDEDFECEDCEYWEWIHLDGEDGDMDG